MTSTSFRRALVNECQHAFERDLSAEAHANLFKFRMKEGTTAFDETIIRFRLFCCPFSCTVVLLPTLVSFLLHAAHLALNSRVVAQINVK